MHSPGSEPAQSGRKPFPAARNRRSSVRQRVHLPASASLSNSLTGMPLDPSDVIDLSEDGVCIKTSSSLRPKSRLNFSLDLREPKAFITATGEVIWSDQGGKHGIHFFDLPEESRQRIKQWLFANAVSVGINQARNIPPARELSPRLSNLPAMRTDTKPEPVRSSPEQTRAAIAASTTKTDLGVSTDHARILSTLVAVKREVETAGIGLDRVLQLLCDRALSLTDATGAAIATAELSATTEMVCCAQAGSDAPPVGLRLQIGRGFSGECVRAGTVLRCDDTETDPRVDREGSRQLGIRSMMAAPIHRGGPVIGLLEVFSPSPHAFGPNDQKVLERLAEMIGASIERARTVPMDLALQNAETSIHTPKFEALSESGPEAPSADLRETINLLQPDAPSSRRVLQAAIVAIVAIALIVVGATWGTSHGWFGNISRGTSPANQSLARSMAAPSTPITDIQQLRKLAADGDPNAQFDLGARYATGEDVKQDYAESIRWFTLAAQQGHVIAQATLGAYYWAGRGTPQDLNKAYFWSAIAQAGGDEASKYRVEVLTSRMTPGQVATAQHEAADWIKAHQPPPNPSQ